MNKEITEEWLKERALRFSQATGKLGRQNVIRATCRAMQAAGLSDDEISDLIEQVRAEWRSRCEP